MAAQGLAERLSRCRMELAALSAQADALTSGATSAASQAAGANFEQLLQDFKRKKFMFLAVEAQLGFLRTCQDGGLRLQGDDLDVRLDAARARDQELVQDIARELDEHDRLSKELSQFTTDDHQVRLLCEAEVEEIEALIVEEAVETEVQHPTLEELAACGGKAKRPRLEELRHQHLELSEAEETLAEMRDLEAKESAEVEKLQSLAAFEEELGLPRIRFDGEKGTILLGRESKQDDMALRSVKVEHDAAGRLLRAEAHPMLGLWNEATTAVECDDLARLLTLAWDRASAQSTGVGIATAGG
eukprot:TRINITY_DN65817_c0_g1_i1.p1 TRINITY_DN65817_c0_g1~~TRINITY_DN65817_c0_g1_i1.p1  ORF type:complete len:302 (+),score=95.80 TRINITY_DN65817_c0_g1_i1:34-939(+)